MSDIFDEYNLREEPQTKNKKSLGNLPKEETGYLDALMRGGKANLQGVAGGLGYLVGAEQFAQDMQRNAQANARKREHDTVFSLDYLTDPEGLTYDVGSNLGSMVALAPFAMAVPAGVATAGAGAIGAGLGRLGLSKGAQWAVSEAGKKALATGIRGAGAGVGESLAEWGSTAQEAQAQGAENPRLDTADVFAKNLLVQPVSSGLEYMLLGGKLFNPTAKAGETFATRALKAPMRALPAGGANAIQNGIEEVTQQTISDQALGLPVGDIYNPSTWTDSQRQAFEVGFASGGALAGVSGTGRALMPDVEGEKALKEQRAQEDAKKEAITEQNKNIDEYIDELDNPKRDYTNEYLADLENKQGNQIYIPKRAEQPVEEQGLGQLTKQEPAVTASDEVRDKIRNMPALSNAQLVDEIQQTNDAVYSKALLSEAEKRGLNVGAGFNFVKPANIVPMSTIRQEEAEKQRVQSSFVTHDADNLLLQAISEQPKMAKPQRGLTVVNRGEFGNPNIEQQQEYAEPPTKEGKYLRNYEQELVNKYIGNPQLFEKDYFSAQNAVKRAFKNGDLTKEEAETNLNNLRGLYDRTAQAIRNNGVIRQTGIKKPRNIKNIISEARQKQKNEMGKIAKAVNDVKLRNRLESGVKTQIQVPYYIQNAVKEVQEIKKAKADEQRKQQVFDEMKQGATEYINSIEPEAKQDVINASLEEAKAGKKALFTSLVNQLKEGMGQGVARQYTDKETGEVVDVSDLKGKEETKNNSASYNREVYSNNAPWYQNWFKSNGRKPNNAELYEIAENIYLGNDEYGSHLLEGIENDEEALSQNKANVEYFDNLIKIYEEMGAQNTTKTTTKQEEAITETPSKTAQEAPEQEQKAEPKEVVEAEEKEPEKAKSEPREDGRLTVPVTRKVGKEVEEKTKLPDRKIRVTQNDFTATLDSGVILVQSKTKGSDNPIMVEMTVDDYVKSAKETANKEAGIKRFITSKVYKAIQNWIDNSPNEKVRQARQNEYDDIGVSDNIINTVDLLTKKLLEKADIEVKGSKEAFDETKNVAPKATNETTLTQVGEKNKPTKSETTDKTEVKADVDDLKYLSKEGKEVFQKVVDVLKTGNDKVAQSAEMGALIYARRADNYAEAMRKAGSKDYTALDYFEANPVKIGDSSTDIEQGVFNQPITNTELLLDEEVEVLDFDKLSDELKGKTPKEVIEYIKEISNGVQVPTADFKAIVGLPSDTDSYGQSHIVRAKSSSNARNILARNKVIANFADVISGARLVEVSDNQKIASGNSKAQKRKNKVKKFYRLFTPVKLNNKLFTLLITAEDFDGNVGFEPKEVSLFEIETKKIKAVRASTELNSTAYNDFSKISIREVLRNVKDVNGAPYINADGTGNYTVLNQTAYHGSPHNFDKFDLGAMGTGEGAQAHGWGLYFAKNKEIAENYQNQFAYEEVGRRLKKLNQQSKEYDIMQQLYGFYESLVLGDSREDVLQEIEEEPEAYHPEAIKRFKEERYGNVYEVDVPENDVLLKEKAKFNQQPETVQKAIRKLIDGLTGKEIEKFADESYAKIKDATTTAEFKQALIERIEKIDGQDFYNYLSHTVGGDKQASLLLNKYGIKGISYVGNQDGECFVVFDDKAISVINRYNPYINVDDIGNYVTLNQTAWHGTPYEFDKFDLGSIGTGEGAQAHGWGLYFAQDEEVAKGYRARLTRTNIVARQDGKIDKNITSVLNQKLGGADLYNLATGKLDKQWLKEKIPQIISRSRDEKDITNSRRIFFEEQIKRIEENPKISISKFLETANSESLWELKNTVEFAREDAKKENRRANISDVLARLKKAVEPFIREREIELRYADLLEGINIDKLNVGFDGTVFEVNVPNDNVLLDEQKTLEEQPQFVKEALVEYGKRKAIKTFVDYNNKTYQYAKGSIFGEWIDVDNGKYVVPKSDLYQELDNRLDESYQQEVDTNIFFSNDTGRMIYAKIKAEEGGARDASVKLNELGVKGITYNGGRDGRCFVVFDDEAISVINQFNQDDGNTTKGQAKIIDNGQRVISLFGYADESTFVHEIGHVAYADLQEQASMENAPQQIKDDLKTVDDWAEWKDGQLAEYEGTAVYDEFKQRDIAIKDALKQGRTALAEKLKYEWKQERFARGFEEYLRQGNAPSNALKKVFQKFKEWLTEIYQGYKAVGAVPSKEVQAVMDRMLLVKSETNKDNNIKFRPLDNPAYQRSLEEIYDDLNDIFEGAKVEELGNEEWRVTTPNGKRIIVKVADRIILNDKQSANMRKAHNLDSDYIAEASGYWRAIGGNDVDGELVISRNSKKGTAYHEILHAVMDLALTTKEKQALIKDAMKEAKATGKDVEEVIAERYRKWVLARKKGQGTAFGKLFKKMQDFYYKLKKLFTGMENAHNIMRKIESGEVWERNTTPQRQASGKKYAVAPQSPKKLKGIVRTTETTDYTENFTKEGAKNWLKSKFKDFYRDWVDKNDALHDYDNAIEKATGRKLTDGEKIYNKAQMMNATATGMANALIEGDEQHIKSLSKRLGRELHNVTLKKILDFINNDKMNKLFPNYLKENGYKDWVDAFGHYLAFRRLREMKRLYGDEYKLPKGVTIQDIEKAIQNAPAPFKKASDDYYKLNDNMLIILEDAGIISKEVHKLLNDKYKEYCPLMRDFSDTAGADMFLQGLSNGGRGIANVSSTLKRISLEGSERGVINPLETTFKAVAVMANRAERNKVGQLAVSYAKLQGMEDIIRHIPTPKGGNAVADPKNSIFTVMIDGKKEAYQVIPELYSPIVGYNVPTAGFVLGVARDTARMLRTGATISPSFVIRNFIRDTIFASISSQNGFIPIVDSVKGAYALLHDAELKADFEVAGVTAFNFYKNAETAYKSLVELNGGKEINFYNPIDVIKALAKYPEEFSAFVESATRMGEFKRAREAGKSIDEATRDARELTIDFSRSGVLGENVNLVVPFFNATIQGGDKLYRLFRDNPVGTAVNVAKYIVLPSMVLWAMNYDDEEYKELDPKIKMTHWIIGDVRIPKPQEAGVLFGSGIEAMLDLAMGNDPEAMKHWAKQVVDGVSPNIIPTVILPLIEWQANYSFFRDGKLVGYREERLPDELQYKDSTSELSKDLGKLTGLSPIKLDNTVRGYTGTMGMLLWQAYDIGSMDKAKLPEKKITELPLIRDFFVNDYNARRSVDDFYKLAEQADKQHAGYGVKGKPTAVVQGIRRAKQQISNINKDIRNITASNLTPSEKRERIDKKREIMHRIAKQANDRYGKFYN